MVVATRVLFGSACIALLLGLSAVDAALVDLNQARNDATRRQQEAAGLDLSGGAGGGAAANPAAGCVPLPPADGRISLLGIREGDSPDGRRNDAFRGASAAPNPLAKLGLQHPSMINLMNMGRAMGMYSDSDEASRQRKALADTYAFYVEARDNGTQFGGTPLADLFEWVNQGQMERMAEAYQAQQVLAQQYAAAYEAAASEARACP
jgi:hypothetical protein